MKTRSFKLILVLLLSGVFFQAAHAQVTDKIVASLRNADASGLARYFNSTVDLEVGTTDGNFSKNQAEVIVRDFFEKNTVTSFSLNHQGSSNDGSQYMIGSLNCKNNKKFRVYVLLKKQGGDLLINQLQLEED